MSSELHKYIEAAIEKKGNLLNAEVISFPHEKEIKKKKNFKLDAYDIWKISDKSNNDQLKAVTGICFVIGTLTVIGLYSSFL
tara:strand:+ start:1259 stop:1504 length:246 start_codon:yes stop_codon:yes gene_type:complete